MTTGCNDDGKPDHVPVPILGASLSAMRKRLPHRTRILAGIQHGTMSAGAAMLAYLPAQALGLKESFWGAITAIAVVQNEYAATRSTARDQFTGAAIGGVIGVAAVLVTGQHLVGYAAAVVISILTCWLVDVASAAGLSGITGTIIMLVPHGGSVERIMIARVSEVGWGVFVAILIAWFSAKLWPTKRS